MNSQFKSNPFILSIKMSEVISNKSSNKKSVALNKDQLVSFVFNALIVWYAWKWVSTAA